MMVICLLCLIVTECLKYWELKKLCRVLEQKCSLESETKKPPKARGSFVVKRMEERVKEALYN